MQTSRRLDTVQVRMRNEITGVELRAFAQWRTPGWYGGHKATWSWTWEIAHTASLLQIQGILLGGWGRKKYRVSSAWKCAVLIRECKLLESIDEPQPGRVNAESSWTGVSVHKFKCNVTWRPEGPETNYDMPRGWGWGQGRNSRAKRVVVVHSPFGTPPLFSAVQTV